MLPRKGGRRAEQRLPTANCAILFAVAATAQAVLLTVRPPVLGGLGSDFLAPSNWTAVP